ncbi:MAG TPA: ABC transporter permease [Nitrososphaerales archaeon]|nr:ABC transporter permease [Nitrososphaerales archaeon]
MRPLGLVRYAMRALTERKLRAVLTILGIVIGPATIVALVGATQGYSNASTAQFSTLGATTLFVAPVGRSSTLTAADVSLIQNFTGVSAALGYQQANGEVTDGAYKIGASVVAIDFSQLSAAFPTLTLGQGAVPASSDTVGAAIGYSIAYPALQGASNFSVNQVLAVSGLGRFSSFTFNGNQIGFGQAAAPGASSSSSKSFVIRGIYDQFGQGFGVTPDTTIFIPLAAGEQVLHSSTFTGILVVASSPGAVTQVTNELTAQYSTNIRITSVSSLLSSIQSVTSGTSTLLEAVAGTSVLVAFIGIMTTMLTSVIERTREIGILKALGSSSRGIMAVFLAEAVVTGLVGGLVGAGVGYVLSFLVIGALSGTLRVPGFGGGGGPRLAGGGGGSFAGAASSTASSTLAITPAITPELVVLAILLAVAVGSFGGLIPAWRASRMNAVEALRRS